MTTKDQEFCQQCDTTFESLNRHFLAKLALLMGWSMDDMRQEFRLVCWEMNAETGFDASKGHMLGYFIGRLKNKMNKRFSVFLNATTSINHDDSDENARHDLLDRHVSEPSVLDLLIMREEQMEESRLAQETEEQIKNLRAYLQQGKPIKKSWIQKLWNEGLNQSQIASIGGFSQSFVSRTLNKEPMKVASVARRRASAVNMEQGVLF